MQLATCLDDQANKRHHLSNAMKKKNLLGIQVLRGIAALLVVMFHAVIAARDYRWNVTNLEQIGLFGQVGVDIFFAISGFVMVLATYDKAPSWISTREFVAARLVRIVPLYWILTSAMVGLLVCAPHLFNSQHLTTNRLASSFFFFPYQELGVAHAYPLVYVGWTLSCEMMFYAVFAVVLLWHRWLTVPLVIAIFGGVSVLSYFWPPKTFMLQFFTNRIILEFAFGCVAGWVYTCGVRIPRRYPLLILIVATALLLATIPAGITLQQRWIFWGIPAALLVAGTALLESPQSHLKTFGLAAVGNASYSIYLVQVFTLPAIARALDKVDASRLFSGLFVCSILVSGTTVGGQILYLCVEKPINRFVKKRREVRLAARDPRPRVALHADSRQADTAGIR